MFLGTGRFAPDLPSWGVAYSVSDRTRRHTSQEFSMMRSVRRSIIAVPMESLVAIACAGGLKGHRPAAASHGSDLEG